jgi:hypothetical protein
MLIDAGAKDKAFPLAIIVPAGNGRKSMIRPAVGKVASLKITRWVTVTGLDAPPVEVGKVMVVPFCTWPAEGAGQFVVLLVTVTRAYAPYWAPVGSTIVPLPVVVGVEVVSAR